MTEQNDNVVDFEAYRLLAMYADGVTVVDIASAMGWGSPGTVYAHLEQFPAEYAAAKRKLAEKRNAKYRRIGAIASDILLQTLEYQQNLLASEPDIVSEIAVKTIELDKLATDDRDTRTRLRHELDELNVKRAEVIDIRGSLKTISLVAENAERRADLNEGKPTERVANSVVEPTAEEWKQFWEQQKEAGDGIDTESVAT